MNESRAYQIMFRFLEDRYFRVPNDELGGLLGDLTILANGMPADQAVVGDWERAIAAIDNKTSAIRTSGERGQ